MDRGREKGKKLGLWLVLALAVLVLAVALIMTFKTKKKGKLQKPEQANLLDKTRAKAKPENEVKAKELDTEEFYNPMNWRRNSEEIKQALKTGEVSSVKEMREVLHDAGKNASFSGCVYKVRLKNGLEAVFKTNEEGNFSKWALEEAAYDISVETGIGFVPPTVHVSLTCDFDKTGKPETKTGFLSLFVQTKTDLIALSKQEFNALLNRAGNERVADFKTFNFVFGNWDVGPHNLLIYETENNGKQNYFPILIDNEGISNIQRVRYGEIPFMRLSRVSDSEDTTGEFPFDSARPSTPEAKREIEKEYGFTPPGREHNYIVWGGFYWAQFIDSYWGSPADVVELIYPDFLPKQSKRALKNLTFAKLAEILGYSSNTLPQNLKEIALGILSRRDTLLEQLG